MRLPGRAITMQIQSRLERTYWMRVLVSTIPDALIGVVISYATDSNLIISVIDTVIGLQILGLAIWAKNVLWNWIVFRLSGDRQTLRDQALEFLRKNRFPEPDEYLHDVDTYFNAAAAFFALAIRRLARLKRANMSEGSKEQQLAKSRRGYLAQVKVLTVGERAQEAAKINKALGIKAPKSTAAAATLDAVPRPSTFGCSAHWAVMPKSRPRLAASASSSMKCNYGCWTLSRPSVRQHLPPSTYTR
jgi:hypothetical protein